MTRACRASWSSTSDGKERFRKYIPFPSFVNTIENYPYPYVIGRMCWEFPCIVPERLGSPEPPQAEQSQTLEDMKAALDCVVLKQGVFNLVFHPHGWIKHEQVVELIDHAVAKHGKKVKFLDFKEAHEAVEQEPARRQSIRSAAGRDNGFGLADVDQRWLSRCDRRRRSNPEASRAPEVSASSRGPTSGRQGPRRRPPVRRPGRRRPARRRLLQRSRIWDLPLRIEGEGLDAEGDGRQSSGSVPILGASGARTNHSPVPSMSHLPKIVRDGTNNGFFVHSRHLWWQNEDTAKLPNLVDRRSFNDLLKDVEPRGKNPAAALKSIRVEPGFTVEPVATEPLVKDPIAFDWGADGKLWVVEMGDYPLGIDGKGKPGGVVRFLEDTNGDGRYDKPTTFLDGLGFPTGVMPWRKGVLVACAPEIFYAEDRDGDGKADHREVLFTGFVEGNQQHRVNGFELGLDGWVYGANGDSGGTVRSHKTGKVTRISGRDFRFRPDTGEFEAESGQTQYGRHRDDWGHWFGNNNPNWAWHFVLSDQDLRRNPHYAAPDPRQMLEPETRFYPISRTLARFNDPTRPTTSPRPTARPPTATTSSAPGSPPACSSASRCITWCTGWCSSPTA